MNPLGVFCHDTASIFRATPVNEALRHFFRLIAQLTTHNVSHATSRKLHLHIIASDAKLSPVGKPAHIALQD